MIINDGRIGSVDKHGKVEKQPTHYATGGFWNRSANATPSTCYFGQGGNYFFVLPIKVPTISEELWDEFYKLIEEDRPVVTSPTKKAAAVLAPTPVVEEPEVIKGVSDSAPSIVKPKGKKSKFDEVDTEDAADFKYEDR